MNATKKCPVCPLEDLSPTALQCPNCKTDLTLLRRIEGLADSFVRDAERLRESDPKGALRALHTALSLEPTNERFQQLVREAEAAAEQARALPTPAVLVTPSTPAVPPSPGVPPSPAVPRVPAASPVSTVPPTSAVVSPPAADASRSRPSFLWALGTAAVATLAFGAGHLLQTAPAVSVPSPIPVVVAAATAATAPSPARASHTPGSEAHELALYKADHHHSDSEFAALQTRVAAAKNVPLEAGLSPQSLRSLEAALTSIGGARLVRSGASAYIVFGRPLFSVGSSELTADDQKRLTAVLSALARLKAAVEIEGHCDVQPSPRNWDIAMDRARSVATLAHARTPGLRVTVGAAPGAPIPGTSLSSEVNRGVVLRIVASNP